MARIALEERLWTEAELAQRYDMSPGTLKKWRCLGIGPRAIKVGRRALYPNPRSPAGKPTGAAPPDERLRPGPPHPGLTHAWTPPSNGGLP